MSDQFLGEIRITGFGFAPKGWALCNGQTMAINQNQALFSLLGTMYGGNGSTTFALPNLQGRVPLHIGDNFTQGQVGGEEQHTLTTQEVPPHQHSVQGVTDTADTSVPTGNYLAGSPANPYVNAPASLQAIIPSTVSTVGGQPHENRQPYLTVSFCIALTGIYPSRN